MRVSDAPGCVSNDRTTGFSVAVIPPVVVYSRLADQPTVPVCASDLILNSIGFVFRESSSDNSYGGDAKGLLTANFNGVTVRSRMRVCVSSPGDPSNHCRNTMRTLCP